MLLFGAIQLVPYGLNRTKGPAGNPFRWRSPAAQALAKSACYDCHSGETRSWWAVKVAPFSWLARHDVDEARRHLDFTAWNGRLTASGLQRALDSNMPPWQYTLAHPEARLNAGQKQELARGFQASLDANAGKTTATALTLVSYQGSSAATIINNRCSSCHSPRRAMDFRTASPVKARALIARMVKHGAKVPVSEEPPLVDFLTR
jgi:hypothetical protein